MAGSPLPQRLRIRPGHRVLILNAPEGYVGEFGPLPDGVELAVIPDGTYDCVHLFATDRDELDRLAPIAIESVKPDGLLWASWPKRTSKVQTDLTRDSSWGPSPMPAGRVSRRYQSTRHGRPHGSGRAS